MSTPVTQMWMGGIHATECVEITDDARRLDDGSFWAVSISFEGRALFARFAEVSEKAFPEHNWTSLTKVWNSSKSQQEYISYVSQIRESIAAGGVYQVNACRELSQAFDGQSLQGLFSQLLKGNPAQFSYFLSIDGLEIASASPERFISRHGSKIITSPIKGTIRSDEDSFGEKDKSENLMIVDLMRNDLGQVCEVGSVDVPKLFEVETYATVHQLVSTVTGTLKTDSHVLDAIEAAFPGGSMTGAPKIRAMEIIEQLEAGSRGNYSGAMGFIAANGAVELGMVIRTLVFREGSASIGVGGGITIDSHPMAELEETKLKAKALLRALGADDPWA